MPTRKAAHHYQVFVENLGSTYVGRNGFDAYRNYRTYCGKVTRQEGRVGSCVALFKDGELREEYQCGRGNL